MTHVDMVLDEVTNPSSTSQQSRQNWEQKDPRELLSNARKAWFGAVSPILHACSTNEPMPVQNFDENLVKQIDGLFEANFDTTAALISSVGSDYQKRISSGSRVGSSQ